MSIFTIILLIVFWTALLTIPTVIAYNAAVAGEPTIAALFLLILVILGGTVAGTMSKMFDWETTTTTNNQTKSAKGVEAMKNIIVKKQQTGEIAVITHWDHFHVDRFTGTTMTKAFTIKVLSGDREGNSYVWPMDILHDVFDIVGQLDAQPLAS